MTKEEIKIAIENAKVSKDKSTELLVFFNANKAYCVHGMNFGNGTGMVITNLFPGKVSELNELPDDIESMQAMWHSEFTGKFGDIYSAMKSVK